MSATTAVIEDLAARGVALRVVAGRLEARPGSALTDRDRAAIRAHLPALVSELAPGWNLDDAIRRMYDADTLVERLGVDGRHPAVREAAGHVTDTFVACDGDGFGAALAAFEAALAAFEAAVRRVAAGQPPRAEAE